MNPVHDRKKYFGTDGIRGRTGEFPITPDFVLKLGWAAGSILKQKFPTQTTVLIGKDTRVSGYMFEAALDAGLVSAGVNSLLVGPLPTPAIAYLTKTLSATAGIVISASHNPYFDNGIKFFLGNGQKLPDAFEIEIEQWLEKPLKTVESKQLGKAKWIGDAALRYIQYCQSTFPSHLSLQGLRIVLDCANGATYQVAPKILQSLGAETILLGTQPDGFNINDHCGSLHPEIVRKTVLAQGADLGIAFDGDGDRVIMVDHLGEIVDGDELIFIMAKFLKDQGQFSGGIVGTVMSNFGLELALQQQGIEFIRTPVGDRYVLEELLKQRWLMGGEPSGHIIYLNSMSSGDGILSALQVLAAMVSTGCSLHELKQGLQKFPQKLLNVPVTSAVSLDHPSLTAAITTAKNQLQNRGRLLIRPSGTEPVIRIMVEGEDAEEITRIAEQLATVIQSIS